MALWVNPKKVVEHRAKNDDGTEVIFKLKKIGARESARIQDKILEFKAGGGGEVETRSGTWVLETIKESLIGWDNLKDDENKPVPFTKEGIDNLDWFLLLELFGKISGTALKKEEEKNSEGS